MAPRTRIAPILVVFAITVWAGGLAGAATGSSPAAVPSDGLEGALAQLLGLEQHRQRIEAQRHGLSVRNDRVRVVIETTNGRRPSALTARIEAQGGRRVVAGDRRVSAEVRIDALGELAAMPGVSFVRRPLTARPLETDRLARYRSGALPTGARLMHSYGFRGQGVRIAVVDQGFANLSRYMDRGWIDRESVVDTVDLSGEGPAHGGEHGTDVARVVHQMAPEAELVLINLGERSDEVVLERAADAALERGVDIVNHSIGWFGSNFGDGTGPVDAIVREVARQGVLWVNAAGNQARQHWIGAAVDRDGDGWLEFGPDREHLYVGSVPAGGDGSIFFGGTFGLISLTLVWNDFPTTGQDLDLHLLNGQGETVAVADAPQRGFDPPREELRHLVEQPGVFKLKVRAQRLSRPVKLQIFSLESGHTLTPHVPYSSVVAPADCACALAVGAMSLRDWDAGRVQPFSARGPTTDGRVKPDVIAPDGANGFFGTSAAAPAAAGAAAVLLSQHPDWSVDRVKRALIDNAEDLLAPGPDIDSGHGALQLRPGRASATRALSSVDVHRGETVTVTLRARMPGATFGELTLSERLPPGFRLRAVDGSTPQPTIDEAKRARYRWSWTGLGPGSARTLSYRLTVPPDASPGEYELRGTINGRPIAGDATIRVRQRQASVAQALDGLRWQASSQRIRLQLGTSLPPGVQWRARLFDLAGRVRAGSSPTSMGRLTLSPPRRLATGAYLLLVSVDQLDGGTHASVRTVVVQR